MLRFCALIQKGDRKLLISLLRLRASKTLNVLMRGVTVFGGAVFTVGSVLALLLVPDSRTRQAAVVAAVGLAGSFVIVQWVKKTVKRFRPYRVMEEIKLLGKPLPDHSFPSGHTTSIFSVVTPFAIAFPGLAAWFYGLAALVGVSRVYLGFHYPTDVLAGIVIGTGCSVGSYYALHSWVLPGV